MTVGFLRLAKGTDFGPALNGLPGDTCQCPHWGYMLEGRLLMSTPEGEHTYEAGQAFYWAPGHTPEALEHTAYVDFSPTAELEAVIRHVKASSRRARGRPDDAVVVVKHLVKRTTTDLPARAGG